MAALKQKPQLPIRLVGRGHPKQWEIVKTFKIEGSPVHVTIYRLRKQLRLDYELLDPVKKRLAQEHLGPGTTVEDAEAIAQAWWRGWPKDHL